MIYANGNNELEPEVYESFLELQKEPINDNINVIVQLGRASYHLVRSLRKSLSFNDDQEWQGVRRYKVKNKEITELEDLGNINMANPQSFADFVIWGIKNYPSSRIMLIISGHGAGFVGVMTDYTQEYPYIMDMEGFVNSLHKIKDKTGQSIDCMVLDACYMNMVEVWNEIALIPNKPVKYLLAPAKNVTLKGLPYYLIIRLLQQYAMSILPKLHKCLARITDNFNSIYGDNNSLLGVKLNKNCFIHLKMQIDILGNVISKNNINLRDELNKWCHTAKNDPLISLLDLEDLLAEKVPELYFSKGNLDKALSKIIICPELKKIPKKLNQGPAIYLPIFPRQYTTLRSYYDDLLFSKNNIWLSVLREPENIENYFALNKDKKYDSLPPPMAIPITNVVSVILQQNPSVTMDEAWNLVREIGWYIN